MIISSTFPVAMRFIHPRRLLSLGLLVVAILCAQDPTPEQWIKNGPDSILESSRACLLALSLVRSGLTRRDLFLTRGNLACAPFPMAICLPGLVGLAWTVLHALRARSCCRSSCPPSGPDFHLLQRAYQWIAVGTRILCTQRRPGGVSVPSRSPRLGSRQWPAPLRRSG